MGNKLCNKNSVAPEGAAIEDNTKTVKISEKTIQGKGFCETGNILKRL